MHPLVEEGPKDYCLVKGREEALSESDTGHKGYVINVETSSWESSHTLELGFKIGLSAGI